MTAPAMNETPLALVRYDMADYLATVNGANALNQQKQLSAAYDAACAALIGPNDVQKDGAREFKKKSAWRKLARHFGISVAASLDSVRVDTLGDGFTAYAVATASAPWGQSWTDVGACGSDEATGRRTITVADAVATAMTRASNRAVSNLIAMGEVSAEEIGQRAPRGQGGTKAPEDKLMPFGTTKGVRLGDVPTGDLEKTAKWCRDKDADKFKDLISAISAVLANRSLGTSEADDADYTMEDDG